MDETTTGLSAEELAAEGAVALPDKEVMSLLDLNANLDLGLDLAAPIDLGVAANANVAAPIDAAASANLLAAGSESAAATDQAVMIDQGISGEAIAQGTQDAGIDQAEAPVTDGSTPVTDGAAPLPTDPTAPVDGGDATSATSSLLTGDLLDVNVDVALDSDLTAPVAGAVAANANVAAPIDAAVAANILSVDSEAVAVSNQTAIINQELDDVVADASVDQTSEISQ